jgi:hypothetical protein
MINRFLSIVFLFISVGCFAQHTLTVAPESNMTVNQSGKVVTVFTLDHELSADELASFNAWSTANASLIAISKSGLTITTEFDTNYNDRNVYSKLFYTIGVNQMKIHDDGELRAFNLDEFFVHFGL